MMMIIWRKKSFNKKEVSGKYFLTKSDQKSLLRCACAWKTKSLPVPVLICQRQCYCVVAMAERLRLRFYPPYVSTEGSVGCCFFFSVRFRYLGDGDADQRETLHDGAYIGPGQIFSPWGAVPLGCPGQKFVGLNFGRLTANISKTVSRSVTCQYLRSARRELSKNVE